MNFYPQAGEVRAVRPEKLEIDRHPRDADSLSASIDWVEFRGASTRIYARLNLGGSEICVDLPTERADQLAVKENDLVYISVVARHVTRYPAAA
jgi:hypothetical protein